MRIGALLAFALLTCLAVSAQSNSWRDQIDNLIEQTDSLSLKSQTVFYLTKYLKHDRTIKETWYYTLKDGKPVFFQLRYVVDSTEYTESYYLDRNRRLVCMARFADSYLTTQTDYSNTEIYFFLDNTLRQYVTSGQSKYISKLDRQNQCIERFDERFTELRANIRQKRVSELQY